MRNGDEMLKQIVDKSLVDEAFRQQLLSDPKTAISEELGITIPESMTIEVHESDMQTVHLALPPEPNITEEQLEAVSAGPFAAAGRPTRRQVGAGLQAGSSRY